MHSALINYTSLAEANCSSSSISPFQKRFLSRRNYCEMMNNSCIDGTLARQLTHSLVTDRCQHFLSSGLSLL